MKLTFWLALGIVWYTYLGYPIVLFLLVRAKKMLVGLPVPPTDHFPTLSFVVAAYNEEDFIEQKIANTLSLTYPADKIQYIFVTDGSVDRTAELVQQHPRIQHLHLPERNGKMAAIDRALEQVTGEVVVFTDANTMLNTPALVYLARHFADPKVGAVAGEKRIEVAASADATAGEGIYWKYESLLKKWDGQLYSVVGAAGELFSVRKALYAPVEKDTLLDDFMISMRIAQKGYRIVYEPAAYAIESSSANTGEELKRKIRIGAGGLQSTLRLWPLLLPFRQPLLSFQYISHRILRWTLCPLALVVLFVANLALWQSEPGFGFYHLVLLAQTAFYAAAAAGWLLAAQSIKIKALFVPYYFCMMNFAVMAGWVRYARGRQSVLWEKAARKK